MKPFTRAENRANINISGIAILVAWTLLMSVFVGSVLSASGDDGEERKDRPSDPTNISECPPGERPDRDKECENCEDRVLDRDRVGEDRERPGRDRPGRERPDGERPDRDRVDAYITRLREACRNGDEDACLKLRAIFTRLDNGEDRERPERDIDPEHPEREVPGRERQDRDEDRERPIRERRDRERPERERPDPEKLRATIQRLRSACADGDEEACLRLRILLARLDGVKEPDREHFDRDDGRERPDEGRERDRP